LRLYSVIDIETTGGSPRTERITEIAIYIFDGENIIKEYSTLINPERNIPYFITNLTGITNEMVADAPRFYEVAKDIVEITEGMTFVAHNARFDYSFIRQEFKNLGFNYNRNLLDTVSLSRKLLPGHKSYSLGKLCKELNIKINGRHRASGDALATVELFKILLMEEESGDQKLIKNTKNSKLNPKLDIEVLNRLPDEPGVYYFRDENLNLIYIGKSKNIKSRVNTHLSNNTSKRAMEMRDAIASIDWECTGNELIALLKESEEIKKNKPIYNRAQRRTGYQWGIYFKEDKKGYICLEIKALKENTHLLSVFTSRERAINQMKILIEKYVLCQKLCGLYDASACCFHYQVSLCKGACCGEEVPAAYNARVKEAMNGFVFSSENFFLIDRGRKDEEKSVIKIVNGKYRGYGFFDVNEIGFGLSAIHDSILPADDNRDIQIILKGYLKRMQVEKIIRF
jgi:DNA polymerase-3 subunit epsilon